MNQEQKLLDRIAELEAQLAAVQQGVQPYAVLVFERGEEGPFDRKPVKPGSVQHLHAKRDPHYDYIELYTHPTQQGLDARRERDNIFFLAGWNGRNEGLVAHEQFKKATIAAQAKQGEPKP